MQKLDYKQFAAVMATLAEIFNDGKEISPIKTELYFKALSRFSIEEISIAASSMIQERVYPSFPKPAEIIEFIEGKKGDQATLAWLQVLETVKRVGNYQSVQFADIAIHSVIEAMGGWPQLCMMEVADEKWKQKEFERLYSVISQREAKHSPHLPGTHELSNQLQGFKVPVEMVKIGFEKQIKEITA
ncbi:MAG: DUF6475 domain-containing protein [Smithella sp.]|jgi:hypothetical protein